MNNQTDECCPKFVPEKWDEKTLNWENKLFIRESIPTLFHIPLPSMIGKKVAKMYNLVMASKADPSKQEFLLMFRDPSPFKSELYMSVTRPVEGAENTSLSGEFETRVFDGPFNAVPKFIREMQPYLAGKAKKAKDCFVHYAYCPKCAKKYNHNYMVLFAEVE
jgi:hypothetical protein